jgi:hypothetical protein
MRDSVRMRERERERERERTSKGLDVDGKTLLVGAHSQQHRNRDNAT